MKGILKFGGLECVAESEAFYCNWRYYQYT